jgi:hypothetical protein
MPIRLRRLRRSAELLGALSIAEIEILDKVAQGMPPSSAGLPGFRGRGCRSRRFRAVAGSPQAMGMRGDLLSDSLCGRVEFCVAQLFGYRYA